VERRTRPSHSGPLKKAEDAVVCIGRVNLVLTVGPSVPATSLRDLIALAKARPGQLNYGTIGIGTLGHLAGIRFVNEAGIDVVQVPYKSAPEVTMALLRGYATLYFDSPITALPFIRSGKMRELAVTSATRSSVLPDVPTVAAAGLPGFEVVAWNGLVAPMGTPRLIIEKLNAEIVRILHSPEMATSLGDQGVNVVGDTPKHFANVIRTDIAKWYKILGPAGIKIEWCKCLDSVHLSALGSVARHWANATDEDRATPLDRSHHRTGAGVPVIDLSVRC
jgi:tripartite-type tricarboxylate transporter receptor subunit TctC